MEDTQIAMTAILVVDDEENIRDLLSEGLATAGYKVITADTGISAQEIVNSQEFDLIITDIIMPDFDGLELIRYVKTKKPTIKIIAISAGGQLGDSGLYLHSAKSQGADVQLNKPFNLDDILTEVENLLKTG